MGIILAALCLATAALGFVFRAKHRGGVADLRSPLVIAWFSMAAITVLFAVIFGVTLLLG